MFDPNKTNKEEKPENDDWDLGTPQNSCSINKTPDDDCESCQ